MYLAVVGLLAGIPSRLLGYGLLLFYNVAFVLPLALIGPPCRPLPAGTSATGAPSSLPSA